MTALDMQMLIIIILFFFVWQNKIKLKKKKKYHDSKYLRYNELVLPLSLMFSIARFL